MSEQARRFNAFGKLFYIDTPRNVRQNGKLTVLRVGTLILCIKDEGVGDRGYILVKSDEQNGTLKGLNTVKFASSTLACPFIRLSREMFLSLQNGGKVEYRPDFSKYIKKETDKKPQKQEEKQVPEKSNTAKQKQSKKRKSETTSLKAVKDKSPTNSVIVGKTTSDRQVLMASNGIRFTLTGNNKIPKKYQEGDSVTLKVRDKRAKSVIGVRHFRIEK
jgi:hypothetical protein